MKARVQALWQQIAPQVRAFVQAPTFKRRAIWVSGSACGLVAGLVLAFSLAPPQAQTTARPDIAVASVDRVAPVSAGQMGLSFAPVVKKAAPGVVSIYARKRVSPSRLLNDPFLQFFFGGDVGALPPRVEASLGSGVLVRADGLVVTNRHVINGALEIIVELADRRTLPARVMLQDDRTDLAILKVDAGGASLPFVPMGDSDTLQVGDLVLAIGNPFGVGQTVTSGIVSAMRSGSDGPTDLRYYIQTDAAINPGNSGGALVNMQGEVVGLNTFIASPSGGSVGVSFAVPINLVKAVALAAEKGATQFVQPWLGIETGPMDSGTQMRLGLENGAGLVVRRVHPASPAAAQGLKAGDALLQFDGFDINDPESLKFRLATKVVGETPLLTYRHSSGVNQTMAVKVITPPESPLRNVTLLETKNVFNGVEVANLSPAFALELPKGTPDQGVVVTRLLVDSPAARVRYLQPGDLIEEINEQSISSVKDVVKWATLAQDEGSFTYRRQGVLTRCQVQTGRMACERKR